VAAVAALFVAAIVALFAGNDEPSKPPLGSSLNLNIGTPAGFTCTTTISSGSVSSALSSLTGGGTLCLNAGSYTYSDGTITKASMTTVRAAAGVTQSQVTIHGTSGSTARFAMGPSSNVTFNGVTIVGVTVGSNTRFSGSNATNLLFQHIHWTGCVEIWQHGTGQMNVTFDGDMADVSGVGASPGVSSPCADDGRFLLEGSDDAGTGQKGVVIENIRFPGSHCTDGVEARAGFTGVTIGPGNEFYGMRQETGATDGQTCGGGSHVDPYQPYDSDYGQFIGNYVHDVSTGVMASDGIAVNQEITNNVFYSTNGDWPYAMYLAWSPNTPIKHNVFIGGSGAPRDLYINDWAGGGGGHGNTSGAVNSNIFVFSGLVLDQGPPAITHNYNLNAGISEANGVTGTPVFVGGSTPTTWAGYALSCPSSPGCGTGEAGTNMGINP
jgi:hypothetical protein